MAKTEADSLQEKNALSSTACKDLNPANICVSLGVDSSPVELSEKIPDLSVILTAALQRTQLSCTWNS